MGRLTLTAFLSLDGVMQAPGSPTEDSSGGFEHGGWLVPLISAETGGVMLDVLSRAGAILIGRGTYDIFHRLGAEASNPVTATLNRLPRYVASRSQTDFSWPGTRAVDDALGQLESIRAEVDGEIQVHGSHGLAQTLIEANCIEEYRLFICPVTLGLGKRLFDNLPVPGSLSLVGARSLAGGLLYSVYRPGETFRTGSFSGG